jgi:formylglycine-generating enzyme required for sulfatase activity
MKSAKTILATVAAWLLLAATVASADVFTMPSGQKSMEFVTVGNPGNPADKTGLGAVGYTYQMGTYDVTASQYVQFLNAVAGSDPYGLYYGPMSGSAYCNIQRSGAAGSYTYNVDPAWANRPVNYVSFGAAARFCNWLTNGQPTGGEGLTTTEDGSYYLNGATDNATLLAVTRKAGARYVLPSADEWYKAAYHKNDGVTGNYWAYPTRSDSPPSKALPPGQSSPPGSANYGAVTPTDNRLTDVGAYTDSFGPYGTFDQAGLLYQWTDTLLTTSYSGFEMFNSSFLSGSTAQMKSDYAVYPWSPTNQYNFNGFRVAEVPEPATLGLLALGAAAVLRRSTRRR